MGALTVAPLTVESSYTLALDNNIKELVGPTPLLRQPASQPFSHSTKEGEKLCER